MQVTVADDLAVAIGDQSARLNPGEAFRLAEKLIRKATVAMITEEAAAFYPETLPPPAGQRARVGR